MLGVHAQLLLLHKGCCLRSLLKALTRTRTRTHATLPRGVANLCPHSDLQINKLR